MIELTHASPAAFPHPSDLRRQIANACDSAEDNGLPARGQSSGITAEALVKHVPWLAGADPQALIPHVDAWKRGEA